MTITRSIVFAAAAAAFPLGALAHDPNAKNDPPGFNQLDKNDDGALSRIEAGGNPSLVAKFGTVDDNKDGKLSRVEYLEHMAKNDFTALREKAADFIDPGSKTESSAGASNRGK